MMKPQNFSWVDEFMSGSAMPQTIDNINYFISENIGYIISLTAERPPVMYHKTNEEIYDFHLPTYSSISNSTLEKFRNIINIAKKEKKKIVVHCQYGQERTGMLLACYLIEYKGMKVDEAIQYLKKNRPSSLSIKTSIEFLKNRYD